jgi:23S rRNA pseudouridine1911/1915/1917 synthase
MIPPIDILYEDNHLLVLSKPAGLPTMGVAADEPSLLEAAKLDIKRRYQKPGAVYLGAMSRLDAPVTGVIVFARTSKAASRLTEQFRSRAVDKRYWAFVNGPVPPRGECVDWLAKDERHRKMHLVAASTPDAQEARLQFERLMQSTRGSVLEVVLETGRKHQIRLQLSGRGWPIVGDRKYGSPLPFGSGIALHARRLTIEHPTLGKPLTFVAPLPASWRALGVDEAELERLSQR